MDIDALIQHILNGESPTFSEVTSENASILADRLKAEADHHLFIDPNISLRFADTIVLVGKCIGNSGITALGTMSHGDTLRHLHQNDEAWLFLESAGELYREVNDEVGWARTRVGRLAICVEMNHIEPALHDAEAARIIFQQHKDIEKLIRLEINAAVVLNYLREFHAGIEKCRDVLKLIEEKGGADARTTFIVELTIAYAHQGLGQLQEALGYYERARKLMVENGQVYGVALADLNIINIAQAQGHHRKALLLLHQTIDVLAQHQVIETSKETWHLIECYLFLNRFNDARDLARKVVQQHPPDHENFDLAQTLLQLAIAEAALGDFSQVFQILERAERILTRLNTIGWLGLAHLYRGQIALRLNDLKTARQAVQMSAEQFRHDGQQVSYLTALLLATRVEVADGQIETALQIVRAVQKMARKLQVPHLSYEAHVLLGKIVEQVGNPARALRHYQIATGIMERIQRSLVLTARAEFLSDKQDSVRALVRLNLELGRTEAAFAALERAKAQVWLGYLSQLDHLRWLRDDPQTQPLIDKLTQLREEHHWYYRAAHDPVFREQQHVTVPPAEAALEASAREHRLSALTEQLYLRSSVEDMAATAVVPVTDIQRYLADGTALIAYYSDGSHLWAFILNSRSLEVCRLPTPVLVVENLLDKWQTNINRALRAAPGSAEERMLGNYALPLATKLYDALIRPFAEHLKGCARLVIVPYGGLHYLPFQLLHDGAGHLIEYTEVVVLPTASLITRPAPSQRRQARALAYSWDGRLQHSGNEAESVVRRFGGQFYGEEEAVQAVLSAAPCQVLHISTHGQHRIDQPEFSYVQLADGPLYTDDLFQHDLRYELVTLSACETGRSRAAAGDELIGLGRGFLFAGAGALIASLWRVDEMLTLELMDELYHQLDSGASKAAALRGAQLALMRAHPGLHPAFWGAFELIGNADPLTKITNEIRDIENALRT